MGERHSRAPGRRGRRRGPIWAALLALAAASDGCLDAPGALPAPCSEDDRIENVALGRDHACARMASGAVFCWGRNEEGQLGDGARTDRSVPTRVLDLENAIQVDVGEDHSCAATRDGHVWCWGSGSDGQLGDGEETESDRPVQVANLSDVVQVALGDDLTCGLRRDGALFCWGQNDSGQAGDGSTVLKRNLPREVVGLEDVEQVAAGNEHACALTGAGGVFCWGDNELGQLGDGSIQDRDRPTPVRELPAARSIAVGRDHSCAIDRDGGLLWCWGLNDRGQLGVETSPAGAPSPDALAVDGLAGPVAQVVAGLGHTCALLENGTAACWGANDEGQLGNGAFASSATPVAVVNLPPIVALAAGDTATCGATDDRHLYCWGSNRNGQLGTVPQLDSLVPTEVQSAGDPVRVVAGGEHTCVVGGDGIRCWGSNSDGQLGDGTLQSRSEPTLVVGADVGAATAVSPAEEHTCALVDGDAWCWGDNEDRQVAQVSEELILEPTRVSGLNGELLDAIAAGHNHTCGLSQDGHIWCWGNGTLGQLGPDSVGGDPVMVLTSGVPSLIGAGEAHTCALLEDGSIQCWGDGARGQLGDGTTVVRAAPAPVIGLPAPAAGLALGESFSCAVLVDGRVFCWGSNDTGQIADPSLDDVLAPRLIPGIEDAVQIAAASNHVCARTAEPDAAVWCWGLNDSGQLGNQSTESTTAPVRVDLPAAPVDVTAGDQHTCALVDGGSGNLLFCWGSDVDGKLATGRPLYFANATEAIQVCR